MLLISSQFDSSIKSSWIGRVRESHVRNGITREISQKVNQVLTQLSSPSAEPSLIKPFRISNPTLPPQMKYPNETLLWC